MRFVLCDDDQLFTSMIEVMLTDLGHGVVGVGTTPADSVALVRAAASFRTRLGDVSALPAGATIRSVVIEADESPADAFDRLKTAEPDPY